VDKFFDYVGLLILCGCRPEAAIAQAVFAVSGIWFHWLRRRHATGDYYAVPSSLPSSPPYEFH